MRRTCMAFYLALVFPAIAAPTGDKNDWGRLAQLADQTVKVHLRDGRSLTGRILEYRSDGLTFLEKRKLTRIRPSGITVTTVKELGQVIKVIEGNPSVQGGQTVELKLRDGRVLSGRVLEVDPEDDWLTLAEDGAAEQVAREHVLKVTRNRRARATKIGALSGAGLGAGLGASTGAAKFVAYGAVGWALMGAGIGAAIGYPETLYESANSVTGTDSGVHGAFRRSPAVD